MKNTFIKVLSFMMAMVMVLGTCIVVTSAANDECTHTNATKYGDPVAETCTEWGYTVYECEDCGVYFASDFVKPHNKHEGFKWLDQKVVAPTCTSEGYTTATCSVCKLETKSATTPKTAHTWDTGVVIPGTVVEGSTSCQTAGKKLFTCTVCGETKEENVAAAGHNWVADKANVVEPTCAKEGVMPYACSECGTKKEVVIKKVDHSYVQMEAVADECDTVGRTAGRYCEWCGTPDPTDLGAAIVDVVKHDYSIVIAGVPSDLRCDDTFTKITKCAVCGDVKEESVTGLHEWKHDTTHSKEPTCTTWGYNLYGCMYCGLVDAEPIEPLGHKKAATGTPFGATCTAPAGIKYACERGCGFEFVEYTAGSTALGHKEETIPAVAPTCTTPGKTEGKKCKVCGVEIVKPVEIPATGHTLIKELCTTKKVEKTYCANADVCGYTPVYNTVTVAAGTAESHIFVKTPGKKADCTTPGYNTISCELCGLTDVENIPATGHTPDAPIVVPATCTKEGSSTVICKVCKATLSFATIPVDPTAHTEGDLLGVKVAGDCVTDKVELYTCKECLLPYEKVTKAPGHKIVTLAAVAPTCTTVGYPEAKYCSVCQTVPTREPIAALGHVEVIDPAVAATCTTDGKTAGKHCSRCNFVIEPQNKINALGHDHVATADKATATCKDAGSIGYQHYACTRCGDEYIDNYVRKPAHDWSDTKLNSQEKVVAVVDGVKDSAYDDGAMFTLTAQSYQRPGRPAPDLGSKVWVMCDDEGLYIFADIIDSTPSPTAGTGTDVEEFWIMIDMANTHGATEKGDYVYRNEVCALPNAAGFFYVGIDVGMKNYRYGQWDQAVLDVIKSNTATKRTATGYAYEMFIPFYANVGDSVGLGFEVIDDTNMDGQFDALLFNNLAHEGVYHHFERMTDVKLSDIDVRNTAGWTACQDDDFEYVICENCGLIEIDEETRVPAKGHQDDEGNAISDSCLRGDVEDIHCVHCNKDIDIVHDDKFVGHVDATCVDYGYDIFVCTVCDTTTVKNIDDTNLAAHKYVVNTKESKDATYEALGVIVEYCSVCNDKKTTTINKGVLLSATVTNGINAEYDVVNSGKIAVTVTLQGVECDLNNLRFAIAYDEDVLTFDSFAAGEEVDKIAEVDAYGKDGAVYSTVFVDNNTDGKVQDFAFSGKATLVTIYFTVNGDAHDTSSVIELDWIGYEVNNKDSKAVDAADAAIADTDIAILGDANNDGYISNNDALTIREMIAGDVDANAMADVDRDGEITVEDFKLVQKLLVGRLTYDEVVGVDA